MMDDQDDDLCMGCGRDRRVCGCEAPRQPPTPEQ